MVKLLIGIPSPRDIPEVRTAYESINHDKLWVKYLIAKDAYKNIVDYFLTHWEYTHLAIAPDDLVPTKEGVEELIEDAKNFSVITGMCAVDSNTQNNDLAMCHEPVSVYRSPARVYTWITRQELEGMRKNGYKHMTFGHATTAFMIFNEKAVAVTDWEGDRKYNMDSPKTRPFAQDVVICKSLRDAGIPIAVNLNVEFRHLRYGHESFVGKKEPTEYIERAKQL